MASEKGALAAEPRVLYHGTCLPWVMLEVACRGYYSSGGTVWMSQTPDYPLDMAFKRTRSQRRADERRMPPHHTASPCLLVIDTLKVSDGMRQNEHGDYLCDRLNMGSYLLLAGQEVVDERGLVTARSYRNAVLHGEIIKALSEKVAGEYVLAKADLYTRLLPGPWPKEITDWLAR